MHVCPENFIHFDSWQCGWVLNISQPSSRDLELLTMTASNLSKKKVSQESKWTWRNLAEFKK